MINKSCLKFVYEYNFGDTRYHGELCVIINLWLFMIFGAPKEAPGFELTLFKGVRLSRSINLRQFGITYLWNLKV